MKTTIIRKELLDGLKKLNHMIDNKATFPVLHNVKIETQGNENLVLSVATDKVHTSVVLKSENVEMQGSLLVPFKALNEFLKKSKADFITLDKSDDKVVVHADNIDYKLQGYEVEEFPICPMVDHQGIVLSNDDYIKAIKNTSCMVAKMETRPVLQNVQVKIEGDNIKFVATDSYRMGIYKTTIDNNIDDAELVLNGKVLEKSLKVLDKKNDTISIKYNDTHTVLSFDNVVMTINNYNEGNYPDTSRLIPVDFKTETELQSKETLESLSMLLTIASSDRNSVVKMELNDSVTMSSKYPENGEMNATLNTDRIGEDLSISYSCKYMIDALKAMDQDKVSAKFMGNMRPFVLTSEDNKALQLLLPVRTY